MEKIEKIRLGLVASGSGTNANAIMEAYRQGRIINAKPVVLISTKKNVGCLAKAKANNVDSKLVERKGMSLKDFRDQLFVQIQRHNVQMLFLVGCVVVFTPFKNQPIYNIHPADPKKHGGRKMYGLAVHKHVLVKIRDEIRRGWKKVEDRFFTTVTVHEVSVEPDQGEVLCQMRVEIPNVIIQQLMEGKIKIGKLAAVLQQHVLPYEWLILPTAVDMAAKKILDAKK